ncbi:hypothetical protein E4U15_002852 [Claviceps sp. LM218 group G6]|nr:hypothetical protein E4U15_002852 [Claviceps sp. LM218 group G6]
MRRRLSACDPKEAERVRPIRDSGDHIITRSDRLTVRRCESSKDDSIGMMAILQGTQAHRRGARAQASMNDDAGHRLLTAMTDLLAFARPSALATWHYPSLINSTM